MEQLSKDALLQSALPRERLELTQFGLDGFVWIRGLTAKERGTFEAGGYRVRGGEVREQRDNLENAHARLAALGICDDQGRRVYEGDRDIAALSQARADVVDYICDGIRRLSGMSKEDKDESKKSSELAVLNESLTK